MEKPRFGEVRSILRVLLFSQSFPTYYPNQFSPNLLWLATSYRNVLTPWSCSHIYLCSFSSSLYIEKMAYFTQLRTKLGSEGSVLHMCAVLSCFSCVWLFATLRTVACQAPLSMGLSRQEYWSGLPCPSPGRVSQYSIHNSIIAMISSPCKFCSHCAHFSIELVKMFVWFFSPKLLEKPRWTFWPTQHLRYS